MNTYNVSRGSSKVFWRMFQVHLQLSDELQLLAFYVCVWTAKKHLYFWDMYWIISLVRKLFALPYFVLFAFFSVFIWTDYKIYSVSRFTIINQFLCALFVVWLLVSTKNGNSRFGYIQCFSKRPLSHLILDLAKILIWKWGF